MNSTMNNRPQLVLTLAAIAGLTAAAHAQPAQLAAGVTGHVGPNHPAAQVPGATGIVFNNFGRLQRQIAANGWSAIPSTTSTPAAADQYLILGNGTTLSNLGQEGVLIPANSLAPVTFTLATPRINDAGDWLVGYQETGAIPTSFVLARRDTAGTQVVRTAGQPVDGDANLSYSGTQFSSWNLTTNGPTFVASTLDAIQTEIALAYIAAQLQPVIRVGVTVPAGLQGLNANSTVRDIVTTTDRTGGFMTSANGNRYIANVLLNGDVAQDAAVLVDGTAVAQEGFVPTWGGGLVTGINFVWMESNADWFARVTQADGQRIVRNGRVVAHIGQPIHPGTTEVWASFAEVRGDHRGNFVIVGKTNASIPTDDVAVLNANKVIARESDALDVNRDGLANAADAVDFDGEPGNGAERTLYLAPFNNDRFVLANDGYAYLAVRSKGDPLGATTFTANSSVIRVKACPADIAGPGPTIGRDGELTADDIIQFISWFTSDDRRADVAGPGPSRGSDGEFTADDIIQFIGDFTAGCP